MCYVMIKGKGETGKRMKSGVLILDLKNSRMMTAKERIEAQEKLEYSAGVVNKLYGRSLVAEVRFSAGDSVQGVFSSAGKALSAAYMFCMLMYPLKVRCGAGSGEILDALICKDTNRIDGEAYHRAQTALAGAKESDGERMIMYMGGGASDIVVNGLIEAAEREIRNHTEKQAMIFNILQVLSFYSIEGFGAVEYASAVYGHLAQTAKDYSQGGAEIGEARFIEAVRGARVVRPRISDNGLYVEKYVNTAFFPLVGELLGVTAENVRQMAEKADFSGINKLLLTALYVCGENVFKEG